MPTGYYKRKITPMSSYLAARSLLAEGGCIEWAGTQTRGGYGTVNCGGIKTTAHRAAYIERYGQIPEGLEIDHLCKNIKCINPEHLEAVTRRVNVERSSVGPKTHCINGHEFTETNTYIKKNGCKSCRTCNAARGKNLRMANPERYRGYEQTRRRR